jgi:hypothetical protein
MAVRERFIFDESQLEGSIKELMFYGSLLVDDQESDRQRQQTHIL